MRTYNSKGELTAYANDYTLIVDGEEVITSPNLGAIRKEAKDYVKDDEYESVEIQINYEFYNEQDCYSKCYEVLKGN